MICTVQVCAQNSTEAADTNLAPPETIDDKQQMDELRERLRILEDSYAAAQAEKDKKDNRTEPEWIDVSNQPWTHTVLGSMMFDYVTFADTDANFQNVYGNPANYSEIRRLWLGFTGRGYGVYEYHLRFDFSPENPAIVNDEQTGQPIQTFEPFVAVMDAWVAIHETPYVEYLRFGQGKVDCGLESLTSLKFTQFMERPPASSFFTFNYKTGLQQAGTYFDDTILFQNGAFFGQDYRYIKELIGDNQGFLWSTRLVWLPINENDSRSLLHLGGDMNYSAGRDIRFNMLPDTFESVLTIFLGQIAIDDYFMGNVEMSTNIGRFFAQSELFVANYNQPDGNNFSAYGAYAYAGMFLTGENRAYNTDLGCFSRTRPLTNFWLVDTCYGCDAGWGAWEIAARWDYIDTSQVPLNKGAIGGLVNNFTLALNWYWNPNARMMFEYIRSCPFTDKRDADGTFHPGVASSTDILGMRIQYDF